MKKSKYRLIMFILMGIVIIILIICIISFILSTRKTYLEDKSYDSIEFLCNDLIKTKYEKGTIEDDYWLKEYVYDVQVGDKFFAFFTYSSDKNGEIERNKLYINIIKKVDNKYELETSIEGYGKWGLINLNTDYSLTTEHRIRYIEIDGNNYSVCFFYKDINENKSIYYDDIKTTEVKMINPFDNTDYYLCYALSFNDPLICINNKHKCNFK